MWFHLKSILSGRNQICLLHRILDTADCSGRRQVCGGRLTDEEHRDFAGDSEDTVCLDHGDAQV